MILRIGKADDLVLDRSVNKRLTGAAGTSIAGMSSDPVTLRSAHVGMLSVTAALNDLVAQGIRPEAIRTTILLPVGAQEATLRQIEDEIRQTAVSAGVLVSGGHTEVTAAVTRPVVVTQAAGGRSYYADGSADRNGAEGQSDPADERLEHRRTALRNPNDTAGGMNPCGAGSFRRELLADAVILAVGRVGLEGTFLLATEKRGELEGRFSIRFLERAAAAGEKLLMTPAAEAMAAAGIRPLHLVNVSEGGILAALWRLGEETMCGMEVSLPDLPIRQETIELANYYDINPYKMESAGCLLAAVPQEETARALRRRLRDADIPVCVIGHLRDRRERILLNGEERQYINRPAADALIPLLG